MTAIPHRNFFNSFIIGYNYKINYALGPLWITCRQVVPLAEGLKYRIPVTVLVYNCPALAFLTPSGATVPDCNPAHAVPGSHCFVARL